VEAAEHHRGIVAVVQEVDKAAVEPAGMREASFDSSVPEVENSYPV
jgi:hypothetical protein